MTIKIRFYKKKIRDKVDYKNSLGKIFDSTYLKNNTFDNLHFMEKYSEANILNDYMAIVDNFYIGLLKAKDFYLYECFFGTNQGLCDSCGRINIFKLDSLCERCEAGYKFHGLQKETRKNQILLASNIEQIASYNERVFLDFFD